MMKVIIFDLGGVLLNLDMKQCFERFRALGMDPDAQMRSQNINEYGAVACEGVRLTGPTDQYQRGEISTENFITWNQHICSPGTTREQILQAWNSCLLDIPQYKLDYLKELRKRGFMTCMLSNTNDAHWVKLENICFGGHSSDYFDHIFLSHEMHLSKPDPRIYEEVLNKIGTPADQCLFLDDSSDNCKAAEQLGIHTFLTPLRFDFREAIDSLLSVQDSSTIEI